MMDILSCQLINCFEGMKSVVTSYQVLETSFLSNASHLDLEVEAKKFLTNFLITSLRCFVGSVVEWLKYRTDDQHGLGSKPTCAILLCVLGKDTLRHFPLFGGFGKQF